MCVCVWGGGGGGGGLEGVGTKNVIDIHLCMEVLEQYCLLCAVYLAQCEATKGL